MQYFISNFIEDTHLITIILLGKISYKKGKLIKHSFIAHR